MSNNDWTPERIAALMALWAEELPTSDQGGDRRVSNSDPITGQAAWFDVRVRISKVSDGDTPPEAQRTEPQFEPLKPYPGQAQRKSVWNFFAGAKK